MNIGTLLRAANTADVYDLLMTTLDVLVDRGEEIIFGSDGISTRFADIAETDGDHYSVVYYSEAAAEMASQERGGA